MNEKIELNIEKLNQFDEEILKKCAFRWFDNAVGISAIDLEKELGISHNDIKKSMEKLKELNLGSINNDVKLYCVTVDLNSVEIETENTEIVTHIFFLQKAF